MNPLLILTDSIIKAKKSVPKVFQKTQKCAKMGFLEKKSGTKNGSKWFKMEQFLVLKGFWLLF